MSKSTRRRLATVVLGATVLLLAGCVDGDLHGRASYGSGVSVGYVNFSSGCGNDYAALVVFGILGVMVLIEELLRCS